MSAKPPNVDLIVFLAVLAAGVALTVIAHVAVGSLAEFAVGLSALYSAWTHRGGKPPS